MKLSIPSKWRGVIYVALAAALAVMLSLGVISADEVTEASAEAVRIAEAVAQALAAVALVLARLNLTPDE